MRLCRGGLNIRRADDSFGARFGRTDPLLEDNESLLTATSFGCERNYYRLGKSNRDSVSDLNALQRGRIRHMNVFRRTIRSLQRDTLIGLVDR